MRGIKTISRNFAAIALLAMVAMPAGAAVHSFTGWGPVDFVDQQGGTTSHPFALTNYYWVTFEWDDSIPAAGGGDPNEESYSNLVTSYGMSMHDGGTPIYNNFPGGTTFSYGFVQNDAYIDATYPSVDVLGFYALNGQEIGDLTFDSANLITLFDGDGSLLSDPSLPAGFAFEDWDQAQWSITFTTAVPGETIQIGGTISTEVVPEPSTALLLGLSLVGLAGARRHGFAV